MDPTACTKRGLTSSPAPVTDGTIGRQVPAHKSLRHCRKASAVRTRCQALTRACPRDKRFRRMDRMDRMDREASCRCWGDLEGNLFEHDRNQLTLGTRRSALGAQLGVTERALPLARHGAWITLSSRAPTTRSDMEQTHGPETSQDAPVVSGERHEEVQQAGNAADLGPRYSGLGQEPHHVRDRDGLISWFSTNRRALDGRKEREKDPLGSPRTAAGRRSVESQKSDQPGITPAIAAEESEDSYRKEFYVEFHPRKHRFDILEYRTPSSRANLEDYFPTQPRQARSAYFWLHALATLVGILVGVVGFGVQQGVRGLTLGLYMVSQEILMQQQDRFYAGAAVFVLVSVAYALVASGLVVFVSPLAAGSGVPEIKSYLNGVHIPGLLRMRTFLAKAVGIMFSISGGIICGREGPMIHTGGIVGASVSQAASTVFRWRSKLVFLKYFRTQEYKTHFLAIGSAAGIAVSFASPLGGLLFVLEEAATHWYQYLSWAALFACVTSALLGGVLRQLAFGNTELLNMSFFGSQVGMASGSSFPLADLPFYIIIGVCGGLLGGALPLVQKPLTLWRFRNVNTPLLRLLEVALVAFMTNLFRVLIPALGGTCVAISSLDFLREQGNRASFNCPVGSDQYNNWAVVVWNSLEMSLQSILQLESPDAIPAGSLVSGLVFYVLFLAWTYGMAIPSGLFLPSLLIGAIQGRLWGILSHSVWTSRSDILVTNYAFIGGVAGLSGYTRMTVSVSVIAMEASAQGLAFLPAYITALVAKFTADMISLSIYDLHIFMKRMPYLEPRIMEPNLYFTTHVRDIMEPSIRAVYTRSKVRDIIQVMQDVGFGSFPVVSPLRETHMGNGGTGHEYSAPHRTLRYRDVSKARRVLRLTRPASNGDGISPSENANGNDISSETSVDLVEGHSDMRRKHSVLVPGGDYKPEYVDFAHHALKGIISRRMIFALLRNVSQTACDAKALDDDNVQMLHRDALDSAWPNQNKASHESRILAAVPESAMDLYLDLELYLDPNPPLISDSALTAEARELLRSSGARHALVVYLKTGSLVGIITRKDILPEAIEEVIQNREKPARAHGS